MKFKQHYIDNLLFSSQSLQKSTVLPLFLEKPWAELGIRGDFVAEDRRIRKTKEALKNSLFSLLEEKPIGKITVKEVVDKADINRSTFYHYFYDVRDMLEKLENEVYHQFECLIEEAYQNRNTISASAFATENQVDKAGFYINFLEEICQIVSKNQVFFRSILGDNGDPSCRHKLLKLIEKHSQALFEEFYRNNKEKGPFRFSFVAGGVIGVIKFWVDGKCVESPEFISSTIHEMIYPLLSF